MPAFRSEFVTSYQSESNWKRTDSTPVKDLRGITWEHEACPICGEINSACSVYSELRGEQTGIILSHRSECPCALSRAYQRATSALRTCHRAARLATPAPTDKIAVPKDRQTRSIELIREHRDGSLVLYGAPNSGKTFLAAAIFTEAVSDWTDGDKFSATACPATFADANTLLDECMAYNSSRTSTDEDKVVAVPTVTPGMAKAARAAGLKPTLVLDDLHRIKATESRTAALVAILKAYRDEDARIVVTSSLAPGELAARWQDTPGTEDLIAWMRAAKKRPVSEERRRTGMILTIPSRHNHHAHLPRH